MIQPRYDHLFGRLIWLLAQLGLEMHSPRKGPPYIVIGRARTNEKPRPAISDEPGLYEEASVCGGRPPVCDRLRTGRQNGADLGIIFPASGK